jgi:hypothetical protein
MDSNVTGLKIKFENIGYVDLRNAVDVHRVKSVAGKLFHADSVKSVCVYDATGTARLYLKKTDGGVVREER